MTIIEFIRQYGAEIDSAIRSQCPDADINNGEREMWILNDEGLYRWAQAEGVEI